METPTTIKQDLARQIALQRDGARPSNWTDYPLMLTPRHVTKITGWSRTFTYEQLRPHGRLACLVQRWGSRYYVSREAFRRLLEGEEVES